MIRFILIKVLVSFISSALVVIDDLQPFCFLLILALVIDINCIQSDVTNANPIISVAGGRVGSWL